MLRLHAGERSRVLQSKTVYRGLRFGGKPCGFRLAGRDLLPRSRCPILGRCEVFATDPDEAMVLAKDRVDRANLL